MSALTRFDGSREIHVTVRPGANPAIYGMQPRVDAAPAGRSCEHELDVSRDPHVPYVSRAYPSIYRAAGRSG